MHQTLQWERYQKPAGWASLGTNYRRYSDSDNEGLGQSFAQVPVLTEQTRKRRLRGEGLPQITQHVLNF